MAKKSHKKDTLRLMVEQPEIDNSIPASRSDTPQRRALVKRRPRLEDFSDEEIQAIWSSLSEHLQRQYLAEDEASRLPPEDEPPKAA